MPIPSTWTNPNSLDLTTGQVLSQTVWEELVGNQLWLGGTSGAFTSFTPTLSQSSALTLSSSIGRYWKIGKLVVATIEIGVNSSGTSGSAIIVGGLPVAAAQLGIGCFGNYNDSSVQRYLVSGVWASSTTLQLVTQAGTGAFGNSPAFAASAGDTLSLIVVYEAA